MGAYLSQANRHKVSKDEFNKYMDVGASSMQGWRNTQEDAHNSILDYDVNASFFAVYDGHGGAEVSTYCAENFPAFLKSLPSYKEGNYEQALKDAFLGFDVTLLDPNIIDTLKLIAAEKNATQSESIDPMEEDDGENLVELHEEGTLPLDEVLEKYKAGIKQSKPKDSLPKPVSPYIRGRRAAAIIADATNKAVLDSCYRSEGSSTSKSALLGSNAADVANVKPTEGPESSSSIKSKEHDSIVGKNNGSNAEAEPKASSSFASHIESVKASNGGVNISTIKENEQNGSVSSSVPREQHNNSEVEISNNNKDNSTNKADINVITSNKVHSESKQNGDALKVNNKEMSSNVECDIKINDAAITSTSTSKGGEAILMDSSSEDDADFDARQVLDYSGDDEEEIEEDDDDGEGKEDLKGENDSDESDDDAYDEDDDSREEENEGEDKESILANKKFCANMIEEPGKDSGCTAVVALLVGRDLYVANAGDSRCVVCRNGTAIEMSLDHKPEDAEEFDRIVKAGGRVTLDGRVNGGLNLSRALGDHGYKMNYDLPAEEQMISAMPDIKKLIISPDDEFMVLACDGIWNFMSSEEVVTFVRLRLQDETKTPSGICEELFEACLAPNTMGDGTGCDNMTAVIIRFKPSLLTLPTKINPTETEDVIMKKVTKSPVYDNCKNNDYKAVKELGEIVTVIPGQLKVPKRAAFFKDQEGDESTAQEESDNENQAKRIKMDDGVINTNINNATTTPNVTGGSTSPSVSTLSASPSHTFLQNSSVDDNSNNTNDGQEASTATEDLTST